MSYIIFTFDFQAKKLVVENGKLQYRIIHLVQAIREGDAKSESLKGKIPEGLLVFAYSFISSHPCGSEVLIYI